MRLSHMACFRQAATPQSGCSCGTHRDPDSNNKEDTEGRMAYVAQAAAWPPWGREHLCFDIDSAKSGRNAGVGRTDGWPAAAWARDRFLVAGPPGIGRLEIALLGSNNPSEEPAPVKPVAKCLALLHRSCYCIAEVVVGEVFAHLEARLPCTKLTTPRARDHIALVSSARARRLEVAILGHNAPREKAAICAVATELLAILCRICRAIVDIEVSQIDANLQALPSRDIGCILCCGCRRCSTAGTRPCGGSPASRRHWEVAWRSTC